jgi:hypothetical protein
MFDSNTGWRVRAATGKKRHYNSSSIAISSRSVHIFPSRARKRAFAGIVSHLATVTALLKTIPKPDPASWDVIEDINRKQPPLPESPWER